jgi:hypothetical protein
VLVVNGFAGPQRVRWVVGEVVILDQDRIVGGPPFTAAVAVIADQSLLLGVDLLGVDADRRLPGVTVLPDVLVQVPGLGVSRTSGACLTSTAPSWAA